ncbi:MAG TPA: GNAT family N-acetyltransferase [Nocardioidaceae bacterium]|nr:GNAT family N-acetyltransferase [Nocardioidaceae bacterium]
MTDLLGVMEAWQPPVARVRAESGELVEIALGDIVSGKPVPPRPRPRLRISAEDAERRALAGWPAPDTEPLGEWLLRAAGGFSTRANSTLAVGEPGLPVQRALERAEGFYAARGLPPLAQVVVGSPVEPDIESAGWVDARPGEDDTAFLVASVSTAGRATRRLQPGEDLPVQIGPSITPVWLATDDRAREHADAAAAVLEGPDRVAFVVLGPPDEVWARGRVSVGPAGDPSEDWAGITDVWVDPAHRRRRLAVAVLGAMLGWAAEQGALTTYLQVRADNAAGLALYERLGFTEHHRYRYLTPGRGAS